MRLFLSLAVTLFLPATAGAATIQPLGSHRHALVQLERAADESSDVALRAAGARLLVPELRVWRMSARAAREAAPALLRAGALRALVPDRRFESPSHITSDPLVPEEWWLSTVGADRVEPPGPGRPVVVIDRGLDFGHPEFSGRPNTTALNAQTTGRTEFHGVAVSSVVGAPANGVGMIGVYPQADLRSYDASQGGTLTGGEVIQGIATASRSCPGVINLSVGAERSDPMLEQVVQIAVERGCVIVAASGNSRTNGSPLVFPASLPHVLTIGATDRADRVAGFSSASPALDLAAPGVDILAAVPFATAASGYIDADGTSFSAPIVAGATAWVWTARGLLDDTQIFELMRSSARDVGPRGFDFDTGFGILDIPRSLEAPIPRVDPSEPNEDIALVRPGGLTPGGKPVLRGNSGLSARLDLTEDPRDVYRVWVPGQRTVTVGVRGARNVDLQLWRAGGTTVRATGAARRRNLIVTSAKAGTARDVVRFRNRSRRGVYVFANVFPGPRVGDANYTLSLTTARP